MADKNIWYKSGLAFSCQACGNCCSGPEEGYVWINAQEIEAAARFLKMTANRFKQLYCRRIGVRYSLKENSRTKDCILLVPHEGGKGCAIYPVRPLQCRTWPYWKENLRSEECWQAAAENCPGMNRGEWSDLKRIEAILKGDLAKAPPPRDLPAAASSWIRTHHDAREILKALEAIYGTIDTRLEAAGATCENCGQCCHFTTYGHRLYASTLEMLYFYHGLKRLRSDSRSPNGKNIAADVCPFQYRQGCIMRDYRPSGCRIFFCRDVPADFQNELSEASLAGLKDLHESFRAPYYYADLRYWLELLETQKDRNLF